MVSLFPLMVSLSNHAWLPFDKHVLNNVEGLRVSGFVAVILLHALSNNKFY